jgi:acyl homoserine lactone synthase
MKVICAQAHELSATRHNALASYRHKVFVERLGWGLNVVPGFEQDQFDRDDTVHVMASNDTEELIGCARLLPTVGRYLLEEVFPELLNGTPVPRSEKVWELSRFAATGSGRSAGAAGGRREYLAQRLLLKALQYCALRDVTQLVAVTTVSVERLMHRAGVEVCRIGPPSIIGGQPVLALVIEVNKCSLDALAKFENIQVSNPPRGLSPSRVVSLMLAHQA